jgi:hypothetical protein
MPPCMIRTDFATPTHAVRRSLSHTALIGRKRGWFVPGRRGSSGKLLFPRDIFYAQRSDAPASRPHPGKRRHAAYVAPEKAGIQTAKPKDAKRGVWIPIFIGMTTCPPCSAPRRAASAPMSQAPLTSRRPPARRRGSHPAKAGPCSAPRRAASAPMSQAPLTSRRPPARRRGSHPAKAGPCSAPRRAYSRRYTRAAVS